MPFSTARCLSFIKQPVEVTRRAEKIKYQRENNVQELYAMAQ